MQAEQQGALGETRGFGGSHGNGKFPGRQRTRLGPAAGGGLLAPEEVGVELTEELPAQDAIGPNLDPEPGLPDRAARPAWMNSTALTRDASRSSGVMK